MDETTVDVFTLDDFDFGYYLEYTNLFKENIIF